MHKFLYKPTQIPYPPKGLFSRKQVSKHTGISDDVLGYWLKEDLLVAEVQEDRKHRRFSYVQVNIAAILGQLRTHGANIGQLRSVATKLQSYRDAWRRCGAEIYSSLVTEEAFRDHYMDICALDNARVRLSQGEKLDLIKHLTSEQRQNFSAYLDSRPQTDDFEIYLKNYFEFWSHGVRPKDEKLYRSCLAKMEEGDGAKLEMHNTLALDNFVIQAPTVERRYHWYWSIVSTDQDEVIIFDEGENIGGNSSSPIFDHTSFIGIDLGRLISEIWFPDIVLRGYVEEKDMENGCIEATG